MALKIITLLKRNNENAKFLFLFYGFRNDNNNNYYYDNQIYPAVVLYLTAVKASSQAHNYLSKNCFILRFRNLSNQPKMTSQLLQPFQQFFLSFWRFLWLRAPGVHYFYTPGAHLRKFSQLVTWFTSVSQVFN